MSRWDMLTVAACALVAGVIALRIGWRIWWRHTPPPDHDRMPPDEHALVIAAWLERQRQENER